MILLKLLPIFLGLYCVESATTFSNLKCHESLDKASQPYLASKRPYVYDPSREREFEFTPEGCNPVKFWFFGRHGTRNPGDDDIILMQTVLPLVHQEIVSAIEMGLDQLCPEEQKIISSWKPWPGLNVSEESFLVEQGRRELLQIGARYKSRFPNLFPDVFDNSSYYFKHTAKQRTQASAEAFAEGIFSDIEDVWMPPAEDPDPVLKFYDACPKWIEEVDENEEANIEHNTFVVSAVMNKTISKVSTRLGLIRNLTLEEITIMYTTCAFETAWLNGTITSPWCVIFDLDDFKVMSYREDLEYYWIDGYGHEINYKQACPPFKDAVNYFQKHLDNPSADLRKVQGYFSHSGANLKMLAGIGLFPSIEMTAANFEDVKDIYTWRSSVMDTMASNMAFTLFSCPKDGVEEYQIGYYFQEMPKPFPGCGGKSFCQFSELKKNFAPYVDTCDLAEICAV